MGGSSRSRCHVIINEVNTVYCFLALVQQTEKCCNAARKGSSEVLALPFRHILKHSLSPNADARIVRSRASALSAGFMTAAWYAGGRPYCRMLSTNSRTAHRCTYAQKAWWMNGRIKMSASDTISARKTLDWLGNHATMMIIRLSSLCLVPPPPPFALGIVLHPPFFSLRSLPSPLNTAGSSPRTSPNETLHHCSSCAFLESTSLRSWSIWAGLSSLPSDGFWYSRT